MELSLSGAGRDEKTVHGSHGGVCLDDSFFMSQRQDPARVLLVPHLLRVIPFRRCFKKQSSRMGAWKDCWEEGPWRLGFDRFPCGSPVDTDVKGRWFFDTPAFRFDIAKHFIFSLNNGSGSLAPWEIQSKDTQHVICQTSCMAVGSLRNRTSYIFI